MQIDNNLQEELVMKKISALVLAQEFLLQCRIRQACKLLTETNNPIQEIARQVGYDNPLTFSKTFKTFCGVSPRSYREQKTE